MKKTRRTGHLPKEQPEDVGASEGTRAQNNDNKTDYPALTPNKSDELKFKVFIADDSAEVRNRLKEVLKENKSIYLMGESGDAEQAITALRDLKPDLVILDIHMPGGGGMRVLRDIKAKDPGRIVIIFTVFPYPQYRQAYLTAGADYFFDKTDDVQMIADVLAVLARQHIMNINNENQDQKGNKTP